MASKREESTWAGSAHSSDSVLSNIEEGNGAGVAQRSDCEFFEFSVLVFSCVAVEPVAVACPN